MKIYRIFESKYNTDFFNDSKLDNFLEEERVFNEKKESILELIKEYIKMNKDYFIDEYEIHFENVNDFIVEEINLPPNDRMALKITEGGNWYTYLRTEDFEKIVNFIDNPDLYRQQKNYNL